MKKRRVVSVKGLIVACCVFCIACLVAAGARAESAADLRAAAERGDARAQNKLGWMYYEGEVVPEDYREAAAWFRKAAEQGYAKGQYMLGYMYHWGLGVPKDYWEAQAWYRKAADQGHKDAKAKLEMLERDRRQEAESRRLSSCYDRCEADLQNCLAVAIRGNEYNCYRAKDHCKNSCN